MRFEPTAHSLIVSFDSCIDEELIKSLYINEEPTRLLQRIDGKVNESYQLRYKNIASVPVLLNYLKLLEVETYLEIGRDRKVSKHWVNKEKVTEHFGFMERTNENIYIRKPIDCVYCNTTKTYWTIRTNT